MSRRDFHILYVDGDSHWPGVAAEALRTNRRHLVHLPSGADLMLYLRGDPPHNGSRRPDLILLDFDFPSREGKRILAELKGDDRWRRIPVVVFGASNDRENVLGAYDSFANCYVAKPLNIEEFKGVLQHLEEFWFTVAKLPQA